MSTVGGAQEISTSEGPRLLASPRPGAAVRVVGQTVAARTAIQAMNALTGILTARMLLPAGRGELAAITLWSQFLAGLTTFGLPSAIIYHIRNRPQQIGDLLVNALAASVVASCVAGLIGVWGMPHWLHQYPLWAVHAAQWFLLITPLCSTALVLRGAIEASGKFGASNLAQVLNPSVTLLLLVLFWGVHRFDTITASCAYIFAALPVFAVFAWQARKLISAKARLSWMTSRLLLSYGIRSYGIDLLGTLALQVDQVIVVRYLAAADLGVYVVMLSLSRMLNVFHTSVVTVLFPKAAGHTRETAVALTVRAARVSGVITGSCAVVIAVFGPMLLRFFYGAAYVRSVVSLRLLLAEATISGCVYILSQAFMAQGRPGIITFLQASGLALSIPMMLVLIPRWGIEGAAVALLLSTCARFALIYVSFRAVLGTNYPDLLPRVEDFSSLLRGLRGLRRPVEA